MAKGIKRRLSGLERKANAGKPRIVVVWDNDKPPEPEEGEELVVIRVVYDR